MSRAKGSALLRGLLGDDVCADQVATAVVKAGPD